MEGPGLVSLNPHICHRIVACNPNSTVGPMAFQDRVHVLLPVHLVYVLLQRLQIMQFGFAIVPLALV
jgi:hypothetical protein